MIQHSIEQLDYILENNGKMSYRAKVPSDVLARYSDLKYRLEMCSLLLAQVTKLQSCDINNDEFCAQYDIIRGN